MQENLFDLEAISTEPVKEKLRNLRTYLPGKSQAVYDFAEHLAGTLGNKLMPEGFSIAAVLAVRYIQAYYEAHDEPVSNLRDNIYYGLVCRDGYHAHPRS